jgi:hypothetical protein
MRGRVVGAHGAGAAAHDALADDHFALDVHVLRHVLAQQGGGQFAVQHHLRDRGALGQALAVRRIVVLGEVAVVQRHPGDLVEVDAVFVAQDAADPQRGGLGIGAHADLLALDVLRVQVAEVAVEAGAVVLEAPRDRGRQQHVGLAVGFRLQEGDDRQFAGVEGVFAHHRLEAVVGRVRAAEVEVDDVGLHAAVAQRLGDRVFGQVDAQRRHAAVGFSSSSHG